jgi:outer membrane protein TolC
MGDWMSLSGFQPDTAYRFGFVLSFPLGDGGERRSSMNEQKAMADKAAADLKQTKLKAEAEVASAWAEWQAAPTVQKASDDQLASAEEAYRIALLRYREGKTILAEVIDARSQLVAAQLAKAEAENYTRRAWTMLQRAMGQ